MLCLPFKLIQHLVIVNELITTWYQLIFIHELSSSSGFPRTLPYQSVLSSILVSQQMARFYYCHNFICLLINFHGLWKTHTAGNLQKENVYLVHLTWFVYLHYLVKTWSQLYSCALLCIIQKQIAIFSLPISWKNPTWQLLLILWVTCKPSCGREPA